MNKAIVKAQIHRQRPVPINHQFSIIIGIVIITITNRNTILHILVNQHHEDGIMTSLPNRPDPVVQPVKIKLHLTKVGLLSNAYH